MKFLSNIIIINGIYDILCAISILKIVNIPVIKDLHLSMLRDNEKNNPMMERFMAYWIFTYGILRIYSGYNKKYELAAISYYIEAVIISNEYFINRTMVMERSMFVIFFSLFLGILCEFSQNIEFIF
jgi:hypothetical protein